MTLHSLKACAKWQNQEQLITDDIFYLQQRYKPKAKQIKKVNSFQFDVKLRQLLHYIT